MANTLNAFGFTQYNGTGSAPTYEQVRMAIKSTNTTAIFFGDPVQQATGTTGLGTGYITQASIPTPLSITGGTLTTSTGVVQLLFASTSAPPVGATAVVYGFATSGASTANGAWPITASTTGSLSFEFDGVFASATGGSVVVFAPIAGVFVGCVYQSTAQKRTIWSNYWPGSDAASDVTAYVINDPNAQFNVQTANSNTTATALGLSTIGQNIGFNYLNSGGSQTNGTTANGLSTMFADQYTLAANFPTGYVGQNYMPFRIMAPQNFAISGTSPWASINGYDATTAYNNIVVGFNYQMLKQLAGI